MGGGGGMGGGMSLPSIRVTLETSPAIAAAKGRLDQKDPFSELRSQLVVISVSGMRAPRAQGGKNGPDPERMQRSLLEATTITTKEKQAFQPAEVKIGRTETGSLILFAFKRDELNLDTKEFTFKTALGPMEVSAKFSMKDLSFGGQPAL